MQIALLLRDELVDRGYCVVMTRTRPSGKSIGNVACAGSPTGPARRCSCGSTPTAAPTPRRGTSVLYPALHRGWTDDILPESKTAARVIQRDLRAALGFRDLGIVARST